MHKISRLGWRCAYAYTSVRRSIFRFRFWLRGMDVIVVDAKRLMDGDTVLVPGYRRAADILNDRTVVFPAINQPLMTLGGEVRSGVAYPREWGDGNTM